MAAFPLFFYLCVCNIKITIYLRDYNDVDLLIQHILLFFKYMTQIVFHTDTAGN